MAKCPFCDRNNPEGVESCPGCGAWLGSTVEADSSPRESASSTGEGDALATELAPLIASGLIINAVKRYRELTGTSLVEAKNAVEQLRDRGTLPGQAARAETKPSPSLEAAVLDLLRAQKPIDAIRLYRSQNGADLKGAKEAVEDIARRHGIEVRFGGCGSIVGMLAILLVAAGAIVAAIVFLQGGN